MSKFGIIIFMHTSQNFGHNLQRFKLGRRAKAKGYNFVVYGKPRFSLILGQYQLATWA